MTDINPGQLGEALNWKADRDLKNLDNTGTGFIIQTGTVIIWPGTTVPDGYLLCDGSAISRTTYAALFAVIGTTYGPGDSSGTFNLPNFTNRFIEGGTAGTYISAGLPNITGDVYNTNKYGGAGFWNTRTGAFKQASTGSINYVSGDYAIQGSDFFNSTLGFDASLSNSIYGNSTTVQPSSLCMNIIIKY